MQGGRIGLDDERRRGAQRFVRPCDRHQAIGVLDLQIGVAPRQYPFADQLRQLLVHGLAGETEQLAHNVLRKGDPPLAGRHVRAARVIENDLGDLYARTVHGFHLDVLVIDARAAAHHQHHLIHQGSVGQHEIEKQLPGNVRHDGVAVGRRVERHRLFVKNRDEADHLARRQEVENHAPSVGPRSAGEDAPGYHHPHARTRVTVAARHFAVFIRQQLAAGSEPGKNFVRPFGEQPRALERCSNRCGGVGVGGAFLH